MPACCDSCVLPTGVRSEFLSSASISYLLRTLSFFASIIAWAYRSAATRWISPFHEGLERSAAENIALFSISSSRNDTIIVSIAVS